MSTLTIGDVPELLRSNKEVYALIKRAFEVRETLPVVSYYCSFCALETILAAQLHKTSPEMELFTVALLDDAERIKNSEDPLLQRIVHDRILLLTVVVAFTYTVVNKCFETIKNYDSETSKAKVVDQIRAALTFLSVVDYMLQDVEETADWAALGGAAITSKGEFQAMNKSKSKTLKVQLMRVLKDEISFDGGFEDHELELELMNIGLEGSESGTVDTNMAASGDDETRRKSANINHLDGIDDIPSLPARMPLTPTDIDSVGEMKHEIDTAQDLHDFASDSRPDVMISSIVDAKPAPTPSSNTVPVLGLSDIADRADVVRKIQKHAKFAVSALNYDDFKTAEYELEQSLDMLRQLTP